MPFDEPKLKKVCLAVLREHIGLAAYPIANELTAAYRVESVRTFHAEFSARYMSDFFVPALTTKLPSKLPIKAIADSIAIAYHS